MSEHIKARLVWDGGNDVRVPSEMGTPRADQMQGSPYERLSEIAGRVCYDSCGSGRPSFDGPCPKCRGGEGKASCTACKGTGEVEGFHKHIHSVGHYSVYEHGPVTISLRGKSSQELLLALVNRPGVFVASPLSDEETLRVTLNYRSLVEWDRMSAELLENSFVRAYADRLSKFFATFLPGMFPHVFTNRAPVYGEELGFGMSKSVFTDPVLPHEKWICLYMSASRGVSHEQVRHGDFTSISQRSTRFCDESQSSYVQHPLLTQFIVDGCPGSDPGFITKKEHNAKFAAVDAYTMLVTVLERWLTGRGVSALTARKQARGAARGYLGNALATEMIFGASVQQWRWMLEQRGSAAADAEIRQLYAGSASQEDGKPDADCVLSCLQNSAYRESFADYRTEPSPDGIGCVITK